MKLHDACGKVLLTDIYATCNVPSFKASANHGFAIKANDKTNKMKVLKAGSTVSNIITGYISIIYMYHKLELQDKIVLVSGIWHMCTSKNWSTYS